MNPTITNRPDHRASLAVICSKQTRFSAGFFLVFENRNCKNPARDFFEALISLGFLEIVPATSRYDRMQNKDSRSRGQKKEKSDTSGAGAPQQDGPRQATGVANGQTPRPAVRTAKRIGALVVQSENRARLRCIGDLPITSSATRSPNMNHSCRHTARSCLTCLVRR